MNCHLWLTASLLFLLPGTVLSSALFLTQTSTDLCVSNGKFPLCWDADGDIQAVPRTKGDILNLHSSGKDHCYLDEAGNLHCWGFHFREKEFSSLFKTAVLRRVFFTGVFNTNSFCIWGDSQDGRRVWGIGYADCPDEWTPYHPAKALELTPKGAVLSHFSGGRGCYLQPPGEIHCWEDVNKAPDARHLPLGSGTRFRGLLRLFAYIANGSHPSEAVFLDGVARLYSERELEEGLIAYALVPYIEARSESPLVPFQLKKLLEDIPRIGDTKKIASIQDFPKTRRTNEAAIRFMRTVLLSSAPFAGVQHLDSIKALVKLLDDILLSQEAIDNPKALITAEFKRWEVLVENMKKNYFLSPRYLSLELALRFLLSE